VRDNYFAAFERLKDQETVKVVDGNASEDEVEQAIWYGISHMFTSG
jgi:dTMP kinase